MSDRKDKKPRDLSRRSFIGGTLATALAVAAAGIGQRSASAREKPRLPIWIGHI